MDASPDPWIERLARLFREHPAWRAAAQRIDARSTSSVYFTHRPGAAWRLERDGPGSRLVLGAAADPDFVFRFAPGAIERLEAVRGDEGAFAAELFALALAQDPSERVDVRVAAGFARLARRGYVRLLLASGPRLVPLAAAHGVRGLADLPRLVARMRRARPEPWETGPERRADPRRTRRPPRPR